MMGKKKAVKKTKELSVAIAEASTVGDETQQHQQPLTPRKRGRPRKIIDQKSEISEEKPEEAEEEVEESESKKPKTTSDQQQEIQEEETTSVSKKERESSLSKEEPFSRRGRARRKGKPRKSS